MDKKDVYNFLLRAAIPEITENRKLPKKLQRKKNEKKAIDKGYLEKKSPWLHYNKRKL